ncbi:IS256 family transposase [Thalassotalea crassostreae]|uniref:IS256 family transposase n=1 Tax=Thalassotalea crassostreae TaxID=1763536 RepID=UPI0008391508|nr:IS256 family transposase [Thalassotalea crassostreae]
MSHLTLNPQQIQAALEALVEKPGGLNQVLELALNSFMKAERTEYLRGANGNKGNGYRSITGLGIGDSLSLQVPRDRLNQFKPWILNVMKEQSDTLNELCFELYAKGLTTRDIESVTESIYGQKLTRSAVSRITKNLYDEMKSFREQAISEYYPIVYLDATFVKTKRDTVSSEAYYVALAVKHDMTREVIGIYNAPTESASNWDDIVLDLKSRGLKQTDLVVIDNLKGLDTAIERHFDCRIQKCVLHLKRNILRKVKKAHRSELADDLRYVFNLDERSDDREEFMIRAKWLYEKWGKLYRTLSIFNDQDYLQYYATYLDFEPLIWNMIYTTNWIERLNKSFKRTLKIRNSMPSVDSVLTLLSKVAIDMNNTTYRYPIGRFEKSELFN